MKHAAWTGLFVVLLSACGEQAQTLGAGRKDASSHSGTGQAFVDGGWKQGDKASWESHLKARAQNGQNDYSKVN